jgi:hypothetical protein
MEPEGSLPCSQGRSTGPSVSQINLVHTTASYLSKIHLNIITHLRLGFLRGLFYSGFSTKIQCSFLFASMRSTCPAHLILLDLIILVIFTKNTSYEALRFTVFSNHLSPYPSSVQIFFTAPCSRTPSYFLFIYRYYFLLPHFYSTCLYVCSTRSDLALWVYAPTRR